MNPAIRRAVALCAVGALLCPGPSLARTLPDRHLGVITVVAKPRIDACLVGNGTVGYKSPAGPLNPGSPGIDPAPVFHSGNTDLTAWGLGWSSDIDHLVELNADGSITWTPGSGTHITYYRVAGSTAPPAFTPPVNAYETFTTLSHSSGVPTVLLERDLDGTTRRFDVFESTRVLRLALLTDKNGNTVEYQRDGQGRLTRVEDVHGRFFNLVYNAAGLVSTLSDSGGRSSSYSYDAQKRRVSDTGPLGATAYQYDANNRLTKITYPNGGVKNYSYDASNRVLTEDDGAGVNALSYVYHQSSTTVTDALGRVIKYEYVTVGGLKKLAKMTDPSGGVTSYAYDANLNLTSQTDPLGRVTTYAYDAQGNVTRTDDPAGGSVLATYNSTFSLVASLTDPLARTTNMTYDAQGNLTVVSDPLAGTVNRGYDAQGHVTSSQDPLGHSTLFSYEPTNGALKTVTDPLTRTTNMTTDGLSRVTRNVDPAGKQTEYQYDAAGNLTRVTDALNHQTNYAYAPGRDSKLLETVTDANGHQTSFGYDAQGRLVATTNALNQGRSSTYDGKGNLIETRNARGQAISYEYNSRDLLTRKTTPEGQITYAYDAAGNMTDMTHYNGSRVQTAYDALNRVTQVIQTLPGGFSATIGYGYDANGNRLSMSTPWGSFSYQYDQLNRLTRITNPQGRQFSFAYDANGRRTQLDYPNGIRTTYGYDNAGQVLSIIHTRLSDQAVIAKSTYSYDAAGNRTNMTDMSGTHTYAYDDLHRLTGATHPAASSLPPVETFSYDPVGNRLADNAIVGYAYDDANRLIENSSATYTHDADGNRTSQQDRLTNATTSFSFNSENQLVGATNPKGENWTYKYDRPGRRVEKSSGPISSQKERYIYDANNLLAVLNGNNDPMEIFTMGMTIDEPISVYFPSGIERFFHIDALGSPRVVTSTANSIIEQIEYLSYGKASIRDSQNNPILTSERESNFLFTGKPIDDETGYRNNNFRTVDELTGGFTSEDPLGLRSGETNFYMYASNNPLIYTDPLGLEWQASVGVGALGGMATVWFNGSAVIGVNSSGQFFTQTTKGVSPVGTGFYFGVGGQGGISYSATPTCPGVSESTAAQFDANYGTGLESSGISLQANRSSVGFSGGFHKNVGIGAQISLGLVQATTRAWQLPFTSAPTNCACKQK